MSKKKKKEDDGSIADALRTLADLIELVEKEQAPVEVKIYPEFLREAAAQIDVLSAVIEKPLGELEKIWKNDPELKKNFFNVWFKFQDPKEE